VIDELTIAMSESGPSLSLSLTDTRLGEPIFIELPPLPVGLHEFSVAARSGFGAESEVIGDLAVVMRVREVRPWSPGVTAQGPLEVEFDPAAPSLEQLWEGKASVVVRGPVGRQVKCRVEMFTRSGKGPSFELQLPPLTLPFSNEEWRRHFETNLKEHTAAPEAYDDAHFCDLVFSADELGGFTLRCEREFTPLRWSVRRDASGFIARLHDDAGSGTLTLERYSFEKPTVAEELASEAEQRAPLTGGLYVATLGEFNTSIIVPPVVKALADLHCDPRIDGRNLTPEALLRLLSFARLWGAARLSGDLIAGARQRVVIRAITAHVLSLLGGQAWARAEAKLTEPNGLAELKRCISQSHLGARIGAKLQLDCETLARTSLGARVAHLASLAESFRLVPPSAGQPEIDGRSTSLGLAGPEHSTWLAEFALRIASDPGSLHEWAGEHLLAGIRKLLDVPTLARSARFLVLAVEQQKESLAMIGESYVGWEWSS
jgi:hypothetical protein